MADAQDDATIEIVEIDDGGTEYPFELDFESMRWTTQQDIAAQDFPLHTRVDGQRYELHADRTFRRADGPAPSGPRPLDGPRLP